MQAFYIGVDGGASKCSVRIEDDQGRLIGQTTTGPANIRLSMVDSWRAIDTAIQIILQPLGISINNPDYAFHAGMGLAGCELSDAHQAFITHPHFFQTLTVVSDAHTACIGAHAGEDGAIIIAGTGVVGYQIQKNMTTKVGGWGFPLDDAGSGAWLGLEAVRLTLQYLDGRALASGLSQAIYHYFDDCQDRLVVWANQANSTAFAALAPIVIQQAQEQDQAALSLLQRAANEVNKVAEALMLKQSSPLPFSLIGGITPFIQPLLSGALKDRLQPCLFPPEVGAIFMIKK